MDKKSEKKSFFQKFKALKGKEIIIAVIAVIIMLFIYFSTTNSSKTVVSVSGSDYCAEMNDKVAKAVSLMSGDKNATVVINWDGSEESEIAKSESVSQNSSSSNPVIVNGSSGSTPVILHKKYPKAVGVIVVINNFSDARVRVDIVDMLSTLLDISPDKVGVFSSK